VYFPKLAVWSPSSISIIKVMEMELVTATLDFTIYVTRLSAREDYRVLSLWKLQDIYGELVSRV
jgi:hypothetical protein